MSKNGNDGMEKLIPIINSLQEACSTTGMKMSLNLPQIAVVGCQSAGKSSVLENIIGRDFLPRGSGIVTRRPLILQLTNSEEEYGVFSHSEETFEDFEDIRSEIEDVTNRTTGENKGISDEPIILQIFSPRVLNLTLVDLPGITKVPVGDQPENIEEQIRQMILKYISKDNCLILAVSPANTDLANSDALKLAKEVDDEGKRTIGVLTKLDLMDDGTNARDILENRVFPLERGYIGIVNRSQKDVEGKKDIQAALKSEKEFFMNHSAYNDIAHRCGTSYLQQVLNKQLNEHIRDSMPQLQKDLQDKIESLKIDVNKYEEIHFENIGEMKIATLTVLQKLANDFKDAVGSFGQESVDINQLTSGANINIIFHERLPTEMSNISLDRKQCLKQINITIRNIHGIRCGLYSPQMAFESFTRKQIEKLKEPITLCINLVIEELKMAVEMCTKNIQYPILHTKLKKDILNYIKKIETSSKSVILMLIDIESCYMNTFHDDFHVNLESLESSEDKANGFGTSIPLNLPHKKTKEDTEIALHCEAIDIYKKMASYMKIVKKNTCDLVPKAITYHIINKLKSYIEKNLLIEIMDTPTEDYEKLLKLDEETEIKYEEASKMLDACNEALEEIRELFEETK